MIAKIIAGHGTGSAAPAIHYIAGKNNHKGKPRDDVIHLFGDGQQLIDLTEAMTCKHTYLSSVLSFTKEESARLSVDAIRQLAESFAAHHADPMGDSAIAGCAYLHREGGRYDVHLVQAQFDLESGKRVDLYLDSCGDTQRIADWQDCKNYELKLDDPRDPSRMRLTNDKIREAPKREEMRQLVNQHLLQRTIDGELTNRADVIHELKSLGFEIKRLTNQTISIRSPDLKQNIRLTGRIFNESFAGIEGIRETVEAGQRRSEEDYRNQYESARTRLAASNERRAERISKKLNVSFENRTARSPESHSLEPMADLDSIGRQLSAARRNRLVGYPEDQRINADHSDDSLSNQPISGEELCHRPASQCDAGQEWQLLDQTQLTGVTHETTDNKIPDHRANDARTDRHAATMRGLSACSQHIEQASQRIGCTGASGESAFGSARRKVVAAIERLTDHIGSMAVKIRQLVFHSPALADENTEQKQESSIEDIHELDLQARSVQFFD
jgi:hypothetical protein